MPDDTNEGTEKTGPNGPYLPAKMFDEKATTGGVKKTAKEVKAANKARKELSTTEPGPKPSLSDGIEVVDNWTIQLYWSLDRQFRNLTERALEFGEGLWMTKTLCMDARKAAGNKTKDVLTWEKWIKKSPIPESTIKRYMQAFRSVQIDASLRKQSITAIITAPLQITDSESVQEPLEIGTKRWWSGKAELQTAKGQGQWSLHQGDELELVKIEPSKTDIHDVLWWKIVASAANPKSKGIGEMITRPNNYHLSKTKVAPPVKKSRATRKPKAAASGINENNFLPFPVQPATPSNQSSLEVTGPAVSNGPDVPSDNVTITVARPSLDDTIVQPDAPQQSPKALEQAYMAWDGFVSAFNDLVKPTSQARMEGIVGKWLEGRKQNHTAEADCQPATPTK